MGPLAGLKVVEMAGIGPGPMCAMLLADMGATVLRIERAQPVELGVPRPRRFNLLLRSRKAIALDLKQPGAIALVLRLVQGSDALIEGFRPGVMERLGLGPDECLAASPRLVYGRMTGWGRTGPLASAAGHDLNYIALTGALHAIGRKGGPPTPPLSLVGDYGGGSLYLALGILAAIIESKRSGKGQVVDAAIVDGAASLMTSAYGVHASGTYNPERGSNVLDSGAPFYDVYECADGNWISIAPIERRFHDELLRRIGIDPALIPDPMDRSGWPKARALFAQRFRTRTREDWCRILEGSDACFAPVLSMREAPHHPQLAQRETFVEVDGVVQPAPAPRFSRTVSPPPGPPADPDRDDPAQALAPWLAQAEIERLRADKTLR